jgi:hypothetical protein
MIFLDNERDKDHLTPPEWAKTGTFRFARLDAGPLQVASAFLSGWEHISSPRAVQACAGFYNDETIHLLKTSNFNWIRVAWSVGFSPKEEAPQQEMLRDFIKKCHAEGIRVSACLTMASMFWESIFVDEPGARGWVQLQPDGSPLLYLGSPKRYLACLNNPAWMSHLKKRIDMALEAGVDGLHLDDLFSACYCGICREKFRSYSSEALGKRYDIPVPSPGGGGVDSSDDETSRALNEVWNKFVEVTLSDAMMEIGRYALQKKPDLIMSANNRGRVSIDEACNVLWAEEGSEPGYRDGRPISNAGLYKYIYAVGGGRKPVQIENDKRLKEGIDRFAPMPLESYYLSIAEAIAFQGNPVVSLEGSFLTDLYFKERKAINLWKGIGLYNQFLRDYEEYLVDTESVAQVAVLAPGPGWLDSFSRALVERSRILFDVVVGASHALPLHLGRYSLLILPGVGKIERETAEIIRSYVAEGGNIICLGYAEVYDGEIGRRGNYTLLEALGTADDPEIGDRLEVSYGKGKAVFFSSYTDEKLKGSHEAQAAFHSALDRLKGEPMVRCEAPDYVVVSLLKQEKRSRLVLHLLNYSLKPVENVKIKVRLPDGFVKERKVCFVSPDQLGVRAFLPAEWKDDGVEFTIPELIIYDMVVIGGELGALPKVESV